MQCCLDCMLPLALVQGSACPVIASLLPGFLVEDLIAKQATVSPLGERALLDHLHFGRVWVWES